jgi:hypothetical protein
MVYKKNLIILFYILISFQTFACSCRYFGGFIFASQLASTVVYGTVIAYDSIGTINALDNPRSIKFLVKEKFRGAETTDTITIFGDNGMQCRPYINRFKPNTSWIFALSKGKNDGKTTYSISNCGTFYAAVKNGKVSGKIYEWNHDAKVKKYKFSIVKASILNPSHHLLQKTSKNLEESVDGIKYMSYCDVLPKTAFGYEALSEIVNSKFNFPDDFLEPHETYLIHISVIIDEFGELHFNEDPILARYHPDFIALKLNIFEILKNNVKWEAGIDANKLVSSSLIIPILLKK